MIEKSIDSLSEWLVFIDYWKPIDKFIKDNGIDETLLSGYRDEAEGWGFFVPEVLVSRSGTKTNPIGYIVAGLLNEQGKFAWIKQPATKLWKQQCERMERHNRKVKRNHDILIAEKEYQSVVSDFVYQDRKVLEKYLLIKGKPLEEANAILQHYTN